MSTRNYGQACSVARFLDRLGNRWTLLIIRDLLARPRRFKELLASAPSMGPNLLTTRLRELLEDGIVYKQTGDGGARVYSLTDRGRALEPVVLEMARWSLCYLDIDSADPGTSRPDLLVVALRAVFQSALAKGISETYELTVDDVSLHATVDDGELFTAFGPAEKPALVLTASAETFDRIGTGMLSVEDARRERLLEVEGREDAFENFLTVFGSHL